MKISIESKNPLLFGMDSLMASAPTEIRTPVLALKGLRPGPLDDGGGVWLRQVKRRDFTIHS